jgi:hypothetical protein
VLTIEPSHKVLTHAECMAAGLRDDQGKPTGAPVRVQVRRYDRNGPYVLCGVLQELGGYDVELFKVTTAIESAWVQGRNIRLCGHDGHCTCGEQDRD